MNQRRLIERGKRSQLREVLRTPKDLLRVLKERPSLLEGVKANELRNIMRDVPTPRNTPGNLTLSMRLDQYCVEGGAVVLKEGRNGSRTTKKLGDLVCLVDTSHISDDFGAGKAAKRELERQKEHTKDPDLRMIQLTTDIYTNTAVYAIYSLPN